MSTISKARRFCLAIDKKHGRVYYTSGRRTSSGGPAQTGIFVIDMRDLASIPDIGDAVLNRRRRRVRPRSAGKA